MPQHWLIGLGAGLVSAVVFVSASTGPMHMRAVLFALTPLAIALAGLGWGWRTGLIAGITGAAVLAIVSGNPLLTAVFALTQAMPMVVLVYLAGLSRPAEEGDVQTSTNTSPAAALEWYPIGRLVIWAVGLSALIAVGLIVAFGATDPAFISDLEAKLAETIKSNMEGISGDTPLSDENIAALTKLAIAMMPAGGAIALAASLLFSLWISARITHASEQFERPWPDLSAITYPTGTAFCLALAMAATFLPQPFEMLAAAVLGALLFAYLLLGLAVVHYTTRGNPWRSFALWALYVGVLFAKGVALIVILLGISETFLRLRSKYGGPPDNSSKPSQPT